MEGENETHTILIDSFKELEQSFNNDIRDSLAALKINIEKIQFNQQLYYNEKKDAKDKKHYYKPVINLSQTSNLFTHFHELVKRTHMQRLPYFISKDQFLYTWVDMQPDGTVKSIYSGEYKDPKALIVEDFETIRKKFFEFQRLLQQKNHIDLNNKIKNIDLSFKFNTEHIVPQSWFSSREPMKGDLHHLFVCQPECNTARSNFPFTDFSFYRPESSDEQIQNRCGVALAERFEPENGKGAVARAMLYFLLRYPKAIKRTFLKEIDLKLLIRWHHQFPVTLYEKHRNRAIFRIQGNRNPFIDFPELVERIRFKL